MRYILFAGENYYPEGGMRDKQGVFKEINDCFDYLLDSANTDGYNGTPDWAHIYDIRMDCTIFLSMTLENGKISKIQITTEDDL